MTGTKEKLEQLYKARDNINIEISYYENKLKREK